MGAAARARVLADYSWERNLAQFDRLLELPPRVMTGRRAGA
jgi:hypothetical protein